MVLGLEGAGVIMAYAGSILVTLLCVVYGIVNWNKPKNNEIEEIKEEARWEQSDPELSESGVSK